MTITLDYIKQKIGNILFFFLILAIILDPTNTVLHLKDKFFILLVGFSAISWKPDFKYLVPILMVFCTVFMGYIFAQIQGSHVDMDLFMATIKAFSPLVMLLWIKHFNVIKLSLIPSFMACLMIFVLYIIASSSEELEYGMFLYFGKHDDMVMMGHRYFFGIKVFGMYLKSFVDLMFAMFFIFYGLFYSKKIWRKILYFIGAIVFTLTFLISGTRSTMLLPFCMMLFVSFIYVSNTRRLKYGIYPIVALLAMMFLLLIIVLASEKGEYSNDIKYAHLGSYAQLFSDNPSYLLFGQGPGTLFYSAGFRRMTDETEWTYLELLRRYGMFSLFILAVVCYPLFALQKYCRKDSYVLGITGTYLIYLFIAGTNPLLLSSTGMIMILSIYSFLEQQKTKYNMLDSK